MKKLLFFFLAAFALCLSLVAATHMCVQLKNGNILKYNVEDVEQVFYEKSGNITPYDSTAIDTTTSLNYRITSDSTAEVISYNYINPSGAVSIPSKILIDGNPYTITSIGQNAFRGCYSMTSIDMPESITSLGWDVFNGCTGLTSIKIPSKVTVISVGLFNGCTNLTTIELPDGITTIENYGFHKCHKLKNIKLPYGVTSLGNSSFAWCYDLTSLEIPESVTTLCQYAFHGCTGLTRIELPSSVIDIRIYAFYLCSNLDVIIDNYKENVTTGEGAFEECRSVTYLRDNDTTAIDTSTTPLKFRITSNFTAEVIRGKYSNLDSISIPAKVRIGDKIYSVTSIGEDAFFGCHRLTKIEIPQSIKIIKRGAFEDCDTLKTIKLPESIDSIGNAVFCGCSNLESINIPKNITCIGDSTFEWCYKLRYIEIPEKVTKIKFYAFMQCVNLDIVIYNFEDKVEIGEDAFAGCKSVTFLKNNDLTAIDTSATPLRFRIISDSTAEVAANYLDRNLNPGLDSMEVPSKVRIEGKVYSVTSISNLFDYDTSLIKIYIPESIINIDEHAFSGCNKLTNIYVSSRNPDFSSINGIVYDKDIKKIIAVPYGIEGDIELPSTVTSIDSVFRYHKLVTSIKLPSNITTIDFHAFDNCVNLRNINIPSSVTNIGEHAFDNCISLTNINIPSSVTSIGNYAFSGCVGLSDIEIPSSVSSIGYFAFSGCDNFEPRLFTYYNGTKCYGWVGITEKCVTVEIPSSVTSIGINAFYNCKNMTSINIPSNVTDIGDQAFSYCSSLTSINIPSSVQFIGSYAFLRCTNLDVTIDNSKENIRSGMMVFNDCKSVTWLKE